jgi:hypothetical protein
MLLAFAVQYERSGHLDDSPSIWLALTVQSLDYLPLQTLQDGISSISSVCPFYTRFTRMDNSHSSRSSVPRIVDINVWNAKLTRCTRPPSWRTFCQRRKCRRHYIQYNCPHQGPVIRTTARGCRKCTRSKSEICLPAVVEVLSPRWCPHCEEDNLRSRLGRERWSV